MGKSQKIERIKDGMIYPTIYRAAMENGVDPSTISNWSLIGYRFRRVNLTPDELERKRLQDRAKEKKRAAAYYANNKEKYKELARKRASQHK
jgi:hypothetical protein